MSAALKLIVLMVKGLLLGGRQPHKAYSSKIQKVSAMLVWSSGVVVEYMTPISMPGRKCRRRPAGKELACPWHQAPGPGDCRLGQQPVLRHPESARTPARTPAEVSRRSAQRPRGGWHLTIRHARREVAKHLGDSSSLGDHPTRYLDTAYRHARADAPNATSLSLVSFPETCPWSLAQVLAEDWWPEA